MLKPHELDDAELSPNGDGSSAEFEGYELTSEELPEMPAGRTLARTVAVQALYESDITNRPAAQCLVWIVNEFGLKRGLSRFAERLVGAVESSRESIDDQIDDIAIWSRSEASEVLVRNVLRVAFAELRGPDAAPKAVVINEAVTIAKLLANDGGGKFVNGVLGAAVR